jgi:RNase P/RNase MRP subunit p30
MTTNLVLMTESKELVDLSKQLGFDKSLFLEKDVVLVEGNSFKELLKKISVAKQKGKFVVIKPKTEEELRFIVEKTTVNLVFGQELINFKDSVHYVRGGIDQIICKICAEKGKIIGFSFADILKKEGKERSQLLSRMRANIKLCQKYNVKCYFGNFSSTKWEMRGKHDLKAFFEVLGGVGNCFDL